jgi:hypothetical protein
MYLALEDRVDNFGHGTHVAGSIVGSSYLALGAQTPDVATGMAPGAKVSRAGAAWQPLPMCSSCCSALGLQAGAVALPVIIQMLGDVSSLLPSTCHPPTLHTP